MALLSMIAWGRAWRVALRRRTAWVLGLALLSTVNPAPGAGAAPSAEYKLKAVFLFNFAQFVEWPSSAFSQPSSPLVIGILGEDPFGAYLDESIVKGEKIGDRPLLVRRFRRPEEITECHILFISRSEAGALDQVVSQLKGRSVLTVGDVDTFNRHGGMVRFVTENGKIQLRINDKTAKACELTISSKILRFATIVTAEKD